MRKSLYFMMAMAAMGCMGGAGGVSAYQEPKKYSPPRKLSPEEEAAEIEKRQAKFLADLERHNAERKKNFPRFKEFSVHGLTIVAHSQRNALRDMNKLMRENYIAIPTE